MTRRQRSALVLVLGGGVSAGAAAFAPQPPGPLAPLVRALPLPVPAADRGTLRLPATDPAVQHLAAEARGSWEVEVDPTSGQLRRAFGTGIPLLSALALAAAAPSPGELEEMGRAFLSRHADLLRLDLGEWELDASASQPLDEGRVRPVVLRRTKGGVRVDRAQVVLVLNRGNLTYVNAAGVDPVAESPVPALDADAAFAALEREAAVAGVSLDGALRRAKPELVFVPVQAVPGSVLSYRLAWRTTFTLPPGLETWRATVDAHTGELLALEDMNRYACTLDPTRVQGRVRGGVRPAKATDPEDIRDFIYPRVLDGAVTRDGDANGYFPYSGGQATARMAGTFFNVSCNGCTGQPSVSSTTDGILDFGTGGTNATWNGRSTPADRTTDYHLNVVRALAARWRTIPWLDRNVRANTNLNDTCNAFWDGAAVNFYRSGSGCGNTGEIRDVIQHEWGHGLDQNDGNGFSADGATGEAYADHMALFSDHDSCIGDSFSGTITGPYCLAIPGCPTTATCRGVRNIDEKRSTSGVMSVARAPSICPGSGGCAGPLGLECHCEGEIWGQADFHLAFNLLTGRAYDTNAPLASGNPAHPDTAAWYLLERLFFNANAILVSYAPTRLQSLGTSAYDAFLVVDDDDGNLANGTPSAAYVNQAFQHHGIAETVLIGDAANCVPPGDPALTARVLMDDTSGNAQVELSWPDQSAAFYVVFRNLRIGDGWVAVRSQVLDTNAPAYVVLDEPVQIGETYNYVVVAVAASGCPSAGASVRTVTVALPDPAVSVGAVTDPAPGGNGDGSADPGEVVRIRVDLRETAGLVGMTAASVVVSSRDPLALVTVPGPINYGNVAAGQTVTGPSTFEVRIGTSHACGSTVPLVAAVSASNACALSAFSLAIPAAGCVPIPRAEATPTGISVTSDAGPLGCTDRDGTIDNGEDATVTVGVTNRGSLAASSVSVSLASLDPSLAVTSQSPVALGALAPGASRNAQFQVLATGASCQEQATLVATADAPENLYPASLSATFVLEEDRVPAALDTGFETGLGGWTANGFVRQQRRRNAGQWAAFAGPSPPPAPAHPCDASTDGALACMTLTSPVFYPGATSTFRLANWYQLEARAQGQYWDRASVHVIDGASHVLVTPSAGKAYVGSGGSPDPSLCHLDGQNGWAGNAAAGATWGTSTFNLAAYAGRPIQIEISYNTDDNTICEGLYVDDLVITGATVLACDGLQCTGCPSCIQTLASLCEPSPSGPTSVLLGTCSPAGLTYAWTTTLGTLDDPSSQAPTLTLPDVSAPASVTVTLTTSGGGCGSPEQSSQTFTLNPAPAVSAGATPGSGCVGDAADFQASVTGSPGPFTYLWDFGDATTSTLPSPSHAYAAAGTYPVRVVVSDLAAGCSTESTFSFTVNVGPVASASGPPPGSCAGQVLGFTGSATGGTLPYAWLWDFGDLATSTAQSPGHAYAAGGTYDVTLTVTDAAGCAATSSFRIDVAPSCCAAAIPAVSQVLAARGPSPADVTLTWTALPEALDGYDVWSVPRKEDVPFARRGEARASPVCVPAASASCTSAGAVPGTADTTLYYQVKGVCGGSEGI